MKSILFLLVYILGITGLLHGQSTKDTLYFRNGSQVIGKVKRVQLGVITFDPDDANDITVQMRKLRAISATGREFRIETTDHQVIYGILRPTLHDGFINVTGRGDSTLVGLDNISTMYPVESKFFKKIDGYFSSGYSYTKSSDLARLNVDGKVMYQSKKVETGINFSFISTIEEGQFSRDNENAKAPFNYYFHNYWFAGSQISYQRNIELGIKKRWQQGLGLGNKLITGRHINLMVYTGAVLNEETSLDDTYSGNLTEGVLGIRFNVFKFSKPELSISWNELAYSSFNEERYRLDGDLSLSWEMIEDLDLNISFYSNFDSNPPSNGENNFDYGTVIGLRFDF